MPRVDFLPGPAAGVYTRFYRGTNLFFNYTWCEWWLLFLSIANVFVQIMLSVPALINTVSITEINATSLNTSLIKEEIENQSLYFPFNVVILFTIVLGAWYVVSGVIWEHEYDISFHLVCMALAFVYSLTEYLLTIFTLERDYYDPIRLGRVGSSFLLLIICSSLAIGTVFSSAWSEFIIVGISDGMIKMYKKLCFFLMILKLEFQSIVAFAIFSMNHGLSTSEFRYISTGVIISYGFLLWIIGARAVKREKRYLVYFYVALGIVIPLWIPFVYMCGKYHSTPMNYVEFGAGTYCIFLRVYLYIELLKVYRNFGYGLSDHEFLGLLTPEETGLLHGHRRNQNA